jgi:uncharacterized protein (DUF4415 family)
MTKNRPSYEEVDKQDKEAQLSSRNDVTNKSFVADLWMKVLYRAIDDIVIFRIMRENNEELKEEDLDNEASAYGFLFDKDHHLYIDDYNVKVICSTCLNPEGYVDKISNLTASCSACPTCGTIQEEKTATYELLEQSGAKETSLEELLYIWDIEDSDGFRDGVRKRIDELVERKKNTIVPKTKTKRKVVVMDKEENFNTPSEENLSDFDMAIIKVLDETKAMLMQKNRKYGNSAINPVRAFSKSDPKEQIKVRIDDKLSRLIRNPGEEEDEDVVKDLIGYLVILSAIQRGYIQ